MKNIDDIPDELFIYGSLFIVTNNLDTLLDQELSDFGTTAKQWLLSITIDTMFEPPPA